jgi:hypothetical protein
MYAPSPKRQSARSIASALFFVGIFTTLLGAAVSHDERKEKILAHEAKEPTTEMIARKERSHAYLTHKKVPMNKNLPYIEDSSSAKVRSAKEIAERLIGCTICAIGGETGDKKVVDEYLTLFAAKKYLTPDEREFVERGLDDKQTRIQFSWRYERSWVLLWALGYIDELSYPSGICDVPKLAGMLAGKKADDLLANAKPRSKQELLDAADLIYRLDWAVVDARVNQKPAPAGLDKGVVVERHAALNWLIGYLDQSWDEITTDT